MAKPRGRLLIWGASVIALLIVATAVVVGIRWWQDTHRTDFELAWSMAPQDGEQISWTDWSRVREELDLDLGDDPGSEDVAELMDRGFEADLTQTTALGDSAEEIQDAFGFSPATIDWELFSQSARGAIVMVHLPESVELDAIAAALADAGYAEPDEDTGVWAGGNDVLASLGGITPELAHVVIDADRRLIMASDDPGYLQEAAEDSRSEGGPSGLDDVVSASGEPLAASIYTGDHACAKLAMSQADPIDQEQAAQLVRQAGEVNPLTGFAIGVPASGEVRVVMSFESDEQARTNADTRAKLAVGPAPGKGGDFADLFALGPVSADGNVVAMELEPARNAYAFSALKDGPVLFATC